MSISLAQNLLAAVQSGTGCAVRETVLHRCAESPVWRCAALRSCTLRRPCSALCGALAAACNRYIPRWKASWIGVQGSRRPAVKPEKVTEARARRAAGAAPAHGFNLAAYLNSSCALRSRVPLDAQLNRSTLCSSAGVTQLPWTLVLPGMPGRSGTFAV